MSDKSDSNPSPTPKAKAGRPPKWGERHVFAAETLLAKRYTKAQVKEQLRDLMAREGHTVSARTLETILAQARANLVDRSGMTRERHRDDAYAFYTSVLQDPKARTSDKVRAQERVDKLLGLEAPTKLEIAGRGGGPVRVDLTRVSDDDLEALERIAQAAVVPDDDAAAGDDGPGGDPGRAGPAEPQ